MTGRSPFDSRDVLSRRGGPVKQPLSRDLIVTEALAQLTREGLEGMSLRKVAAALETGPASLYAYVDDLQALQALVLDRALAAVDVSGGRRRGWRERVKAVLDSYVRVLLASPGLAQLAMSPIAVGPRALRILETLLGLLEEGGLTQTSAAWAVDLLMLYGTAIGVEQSNGHNPSDPESPSARALSGAPAEEYPRLHAAAEELLAGDGEARFSWAIDVLITGVLQSPAPKWVGKRVVKAKPKPSR